MKQCSKCRERKPFSEFYKNKTRKDGFHPQCKKCMNNCIQKYQQTHKVERTAYMQKYRQTHKTKRAKYGRKCRKTITGCLRHRFAVIKHRCNNPNNPRYGNYGGRGVKCLFKNANEFINYVITELKIDPHNLTVDRIDNDGNYEPGNIRLVTQAENNRNKRRTKCHYQRIHQ